MSSLVFTFDAHKKIKPNTTTEQRIAALLNGVSEVAVVGNGPISEVDRQEIAKHGFIIRFNDANFLRAGEKTSLHVIRHPSNPSKVAIDAPIWHVSPRLSPMWASGIATLNYESQMGARNDAPPNSRIFTACNCGPSCFENSNTAWAGASTGAAALSVLHGMPEVKKINVYGMNWNGPTYHIDFENTSLVKGCCTTCQFHETASSAYGSEQPAGVILLIIIGSVVGGVLFLYTCAELVWRGGRSGACDACNPVLHFEDDELMKGDESSDDEQGGDGEESRR